MISKWILNNLNDKFPNLKQCFKVLISVEFNKAESGNFLTVLSSEKGSLDHYASRKTKNYPNLWSWINTFLFDIRSNRVVQSFLAWKGSSAKSPFFFFFDDLILCKGFCQNSAISFAHMELWQNHLRSFF